MTHIKFSLISLFLVWLVAGCAQAVVSPIPHNNEIDPYINFLQTQKQAPVDYLLGLFDHYDIVIICERAHPETTQYDLYFQLASDKRFIDKVSSIFLEIGTSTLQPEMDELMLSKTDFSSADITHRIAYIGQNIGHDLFWEKTNYYDFIRKLYDLNRTLPEDERIRVFPSDVPFSWEGMTPARYQDFTTNTLNNRDKIIADQVISNFTRLIHSVEKRKKALVIMNYRHGFNNALLADGNKADNVGRYIMDQFPQATANVMINTVATLAESTDQTVYFAPIQGGKWDAAFEALVNPSLGFNFKGTLFGRDSFDMARNQMPAGSYAKLEYQDIFTGFIFYKPPKEHILSAGVPGLYTWDEFTSIFYPRAYILDTGLPAPGSAEARALLDSKAAHDLFINLVTIKTYTYGTLDKYASAFGAWFNGTSTP